MMMLPEKPHAWRAHTIHNLTSIDGGMRWWLRLLKWPRRRRRWLAAAVFVSRTCMTVAAGGANDAPAGPQPHTRLALMAGSPERKGGTCARLQHNTPAQRLQGR